VGYRADVHVHQAALRDALADDVRRGLRDRPKSLPPKYFYDAAGSRLFEAICRLDEYYPTRRERAILTDHAAAYAGYRWQQIGENIAAGQGSAEQVVAGWLASPGHCANIMNPGFTEMGAAYATSEGGAAGSYWTQVFGTPR